MADAINPSHYKDTLVIPASRVKEFTAEDGSIHLQYMDICEFIMTEEQFRGHLVGQQLKYLLRLGKKDDPVQESKKTGWYNARMTSWLKNISK